MSAPVTNVMNGIADALWVSAFASWVDEIGRSEAQKRGIDVPSGGEDWSDYAPEVPDEAHAAARAVAEAYENDNACDLMDLAKRAGVLAGGRVDAKARYDLEQDQSLFGWYLGMMSMGTGVSWFDDHERFDLVVPPVETMFDGEFFSWSTGRVHKNPPWVPIGVSGGGRYVVYYRDGRKSFAFEDETLARDWAKEIGGGTVEDRGPGGYVHYARNPPKNWKPSFTMSVAFPDEGDNEERVIKAGIWNNKTGSGSDLRGVRDVSFRYKSKEAGENAMDRIAALRIRGLRAELKTYDWDTEEHPVIRTIGARGNPVGDRVDVMAGPGRGRSGVVESETQHVARVRFDRGGSGHLERSDLRTKGPSRR